MIIICIIIILIIVAIVYSVQKEQQENTNCQIVSDIRSLYKKLIPIVISSYDLKICLKCFERRMDLLTVSPTGQSIEYECTNCHKKITSKILPGKEGNEASRLFIEIKRNLESLHYPLSNDIFHEDASNDFIVSIDHDNSKDRGYRPSIPESVRNEVWRRDQGKCVSCGSQINLEFDHIIPISKGGSSTARNLQLLCETCNRSKSAKI